MKKHTQVLRILCFSLLLFSLPGFTQSADDTPPADADNNPADKNDNPPPRGQEVEVNEDNYRQFMELKDARQMRSGLPENAFKPDSGIQKLDKLPEESQKHLRNQLREIIVQGNQWQPGDESKNYPYVPSQAALADTQLQKQEAEAWGELVDSYHKREAQIYENSARSKAAMASENALNGTPGQGQGGQQGSSTNAGGQNSATGQADQQRRSKQNREQSQEPPNTANITNSTSTAGVSQNAMEFLKGQGDQGDKSAHGSAETSSDQDGDGDGDQPAGIDPQYTETQKNDSTYVEADTSERIPGDANDDATTGVSQNALEYLTGEELPAESSQQIDPANPAGISGTLSIDDLLNAQGVGQGSGVPAPPKPTDDQQPGQNPPDKDGSP